MAQPASSARCSAGVRIRREFHDFEEMQTATPGWNTRCVKLDAGPFAGRITAVVANRFQIGTVSRSARVLLQGAPPAGTCVIGVSLGREPLTVQGETISYLDTFACGSGREFECSASAKRSRRDGGPKAPQVHSR